MKEFTGKKEYWKDKTYFSIDAFFTDEQSKEIQDMLKEVKLKAKQFANDNDKLSKGMKFRRFKFYDMFWIFALFVMTFTFSSIQSSNNAFAKSGGNDPVGMSFISKKLQATATKIGGGGGNDPTANYIDNDISDNTGGGGGHDPENASVICNVVIGNTFYKGLLDIETSSCLILNE